MLLWLRRILIIQSIAALACFAAELFCRYALHLGKPYDRPILVGETRTFSDFALWLPRFDHLHSKDFFGPGPPPFMYPAAGALFYAPFVPLGPHRVFLFATALFALSAVATALFIRALVRRGLPPLQTALTVALVVLLSYPFWFELERGNIELLVWMVGAVGIWAFYRGRGYSAATCFALAGAAKLYGLIFLSLFLGRKEQLRYIAFGIAMSVLFTLAALWLLCPDVLYAFHGIQHGFQTFDSHYVAQFMPHAVGYDHSLLALCKHLLWPRHDSYGAASKLYLAAVALAGIALYIWKIRTAPFVNQVMALTVATILLPPVSFDYTLLNLYTPICLLVVVATASGLTRGGKIALLLFALIASPMTEIITRAISWEGQLKALLLLALFIVALRYPLQTAQAPEPIPLVS
jgi:hypothetical protein